MIEEVLALFNIDLLTVTVLSGMVLLMVEKAKGMVPTLKRLGTEIVALCSSFLLAILILASNGVIDWLQVIILGIVCWIVPGGTKAGVNKTIEKLRSPK